MCPQILKMHQERLLTKGSFFARSPTNEPQGFRERRRRERRKIGDFAGNIAPKFTPEMLFSEVSPCYAIISPLHRLNYKAQKRPPLTVFFKIGSLTVHEKPPANGKRNRS